MSIIIGRNSALVALVCARVLLPSIAFAQSAPATRGNATASQPPVIGETFPLRSQVLHETRRMKVYVPPVYADSLSVRLPVLYMPDGGMAEDFLHVAGLVQVSTGNGTMRPFILVGIENTERRRDLTGPTDVASNKTIVPRVGGSAVFRDFIRTELMPEIKHRYRTTQATAIVGESLAGLFIVETFLLEPTLFDTYIAIDPSLWWNDGKLVGGATTQIRAVNGAMSGAPSGTKSLWFSTSREGSAELADRFASELKADRERAIIEL